MMLSKISLPQNDISFFNEEKSSLRIQLLQNPLPPSALVDLLAREEGEMEIIFWCEGTHGLPKKGAVFMKQLFTPLYEKKKNLKFYPYCLKGWDFRKTVEAMPTSTPLGEAINKVNKNALQCLYAYDFFRFCFQPVDKSELHIYLSELLPKKSSLLDMSSASKASGMKVNALFCHKPSLFSCFKDYDANAVYAPMQYVEGYYLIRESVTRGLQANKTKIKIAFVLPNTETQYYTDFPKDLKKLLELDFGKSLKVLEIEVLIYSFFYEDGVKERPYIDKNRNAPKVLSEEVSFYFDYTQKRCTLFLRDMIHNLYEI